MNPPKEPTAGFWITVALVVVVVGYPLSFGPACWWLLEPDQQENDWQTSTRAPTIYEPIGWLHHRTPSWLSDAFDAYITLYMSDGHIVHIPDTEGGVSWMRPIQ
jgi:hypothetical protein